MGSFHPKQLQSHCSSQKERKSVYEESRQTQREDSSQNSQDFTGKDVREEHLLLGVNKDNYFSEEDLKITQAKYPDILDLEKNLKQNQKQKPKTKKIRWKEGEIIGKGSYGNVRIGLNLDTGHIMAVKQVELSQKSSKIQQKKIESLEVEIEFLSQFSHKNIVKYYGSSRTKDTLNIFLEYISGGSLASIIKKFGPLNENIIKIYTRQILEGLEYLHARNTIHRDIKGANILVDNKGVCKLTDFGTATQISSLIEMKNTNRETDPPEIKGTLNWMAPECLQQKILGRQCDIWSVGCTVLEMATGQPPWADLSKTTYCTNYMGLLYQIGKQGSSPEIPKNLSPDMLDFLTLCFKINPQERPNILKLLKHKFLLVIETPSKILLPNLNEESLFKKEKKKFFNFNPEEVQSNLLIKYLIKSNQIDESSLNSDGKSPGSKHISNTPLSGRRRFKFHEGEQGNFSLQEVDEEKDNSKNDSNFKGLSTPICSKLSQRRKKSNEIDPGHLGTSMKTNIKSSESIANKDDKISKNQANHDENFKSESELLTLKNEKKVPRANVYQSKIVRGYPKRCGSIEAIIPPKSMFGLMFPHRSQATMSYKHPSEEEKANQSEENNKENEQNEEPELLDFPEMPNYEEEEYEKALDDFFSVNEKESDDKSTQLKWEEKFTGVNINPIQESLKELGEFNLQEDLENIYQKIEDTDFIIQ